MNKHDIIDKLNRDFTWKKDPIFEHLRITKGDKVVDDCDGYALTALYRLKGSTMGLFWSLLTRESRISYCKVKGGDYHYALKYQGEYVDNVYPYWRKDLKHKHILYVWFIVIIFWLLVGKAYDTIIGDYRK